MPFKPQIDMYGAVYDNMESVPFKPQIDMYGAVYVLALYIGTIYAFYLLLIGQAKWLTFVASK